MGRTKAVLGAGARLSDYLSASLLARVYTPEWVFQALDRHGVGRVSAHVACRRWRQATTAWR